MRIDRSSTLFLLFTVAAWAACVYLGRDPGHPVPAGEPTAVPSGPDWMHLLHEDHAAGWKNITDDLDIFEIRDQTLHIFGRTLFPLRYAAFTSQRFSDFDLHLEFKLKPGANSGVFLRMQEADPLNRGFEVQVLEDAGEPPNIHGSAAIYDVVSPMFNLARPAGEWNSYDISVRGSAVSVTMNGWRVIDTTFDQMTTPLGKFSRPYAEMPREGIIALQDHGGEIWYRNIMVRPR